ncbi:MAG: tRNA uridine-5-carboxymethylaminomethyl(34) synthesis enzyme MnmG [Clostridia bacterium]|nr:tRNA uridine-5-carboxymethylaminomethyl(34) synthesis enzyme MnmG [Clostridia bacterium]
MNTEDEIINKTNYNEDYEVSVIGAGHAGIEAGLAAARLGCKTVVFAVNLDSVGNCPCNPSIGGTAKGHLVREIDALGGEMGRTTDECFLQSRMLNLGKGPAVHSLRAQIDRNKYKEIMKHKLELQENLSLKQAEIIDIFRDKTNEKWVLTSRNGIKYASKCVVLATGTFLEGVVHIGETSYQSGPDGIFPAVLLGESLKKLGLKLKRFKTGTPARVLRSSINFENLEEQCGDENIVPFSYDTENVGENKVKCYISWTNDKTKEVILKNIHRAPMYSGKIEGVGPRYCPSIEDKIVRFPEKKRHQMFIEPCGLNTEEMYLQGMSTSLPEEVQIEMYRTIPGLENVKIMRAAYAIEYDIADPQQMNSTLEFKEYSGLFGAGQFNGSSGYEEAAAQGLIAGINAALKVKNREQLILDRGTSYIGTLIDDLVTKGVNDPYRMMTSRSEYRLVLRQDNADERLTPIGRKIGLISDERYEKFTKYLSLKCEEKQRVKNVVIAPSEELNQVLVSRETSPIITGVKMSDLLKRPQVTYKDLEAFDKTRPNIDKSIFEKVEVEIKYEGYIARQNNQIKELRRLEEKLIPNDIDYKQIKGLRLEAIEKLGKIKPQNIGQASRISGVSPADISVLIIWLSAKTRKKEGC